MRQQSSEVGRSLKTARGTVDRGSASARIQTSPLSFRLRLLVTSARSRHLTLHFGCIVQQLRLNLRNKNQSCAPLHSSTPEPGATKACADERPRRHSKESFMLGQVTGRRCVDVEMWNTGEEGSSRLVIAGRRSWTAWAGPMSQHTKRHRFHRNSTSSVKFWRHSNIQYSGYVRLSRGELATDEKKYTSSARMHQLKKWHLVLYARIAALPPGHTNTRK